MIFNVAIAYLLWFVGGCGVLGLHRFYLRKTGTAILWIFTGGLGFAGALYDFFTLPRQVEEANIKAGIKQVLENRNYMMDAGSKPVAPDSIEKAILRVASRKNGLVSPGEVALESTYTVDESRAALEKLAANGSAEMLIRKSGIIVFRFAEFQRAGDDDFIS